MPSRKNSSARRPPIAEPDRVRVELQPATAVFGARLTARQILDAACTEAIPT